MDSENTATEIPQIDFSSLFLEEPFYSLELNDDRTDKSPPTKRKINITEEVTNKRTRKQNKAQEPDTNGKFVITKCSVEELHVCFQCKIKRKMSYNLRKADLDSYLCGENCLNIFTMENRDRYELSWLPRISVRNFTGLPTDRLFVRHCSVCQSASNTNYSLTWQGMNFCNDVCLLKRQRELGPVCLNCTTAVSLEALGRFSARFGGDIRQFCSSSCLIQHKNKFKSCSYCLQDVSRKFLQIFSGSERFCSQRCEDDFRRLKKGPPVANVEDVACSVCHQVGPSLLKYEAYGSPPSDFCSEKCLGDYFAMYNVEAAKCCNCCKFTPKEYLKQHTVFHKYLLYVFCSPICRNLFINDNREVVDCPRCGVKKFTRDTVKKFQSLATVEACSLNCLGLLQRDLYSTNSLCFYCYCFKPEMFSFPTSDGGNQYFCSIECLDAFIHNKANTNPPIVTGDQENKTESETTVQNPQMLNNVLITPKPILAQVDASTMCQVKQHDKATMVKEVETCQKAIQTEKLYIPLSLPKRQGFAATKRLELDKMVQLQEGDLVKWAKNGSEVNYTFVSNGKNNVGNNQLSHEDWKFISLEQLARNLQEDYFKSDCVECPLGVNAWGYWTAIKRASPPITDLLELDVDELNVSLGRFVQEVKSPDGTEYTTDTIYYLCLGIQKYLIDNGRNDNIFQDSEYQYFNSCLDRLTSTFQLPLELSSFKIEENHLWETRQLGIYSPRVLTFTLIFFFTKYFKLLTVHGHMGLSIKQIAEQFVGSDGYIPETITIKLALFEINDTRFILKRNTDIPKRCPIRICHFYLTKCPSDIKSSHQLFYLRPDDRASDGPFWFTTASLPAETLQRSLNLVKMVKEVNEMDYFY